MAALVTAAAGKIEPRLIIRELSRETVVYVDGSAVSAERTTRFRRLTPLPARAPTARLPAVRGRATRRRALLGQTTVLKRRGNRHPRALLLAAAVLTLGLGAGAGAALLRSRQAVRGTPTGTRPPPRVQRLTLGQTKRVEPVTRPAAPVTDARANRALERQLVAAQRALRRHQLRRARRHLAAALRLHRGEAPHRHRLSRTQRNRCRRELARARRALRLHRWHRARRHALAVLRLQPRHRHAAAIYRLARRRQRRRVN
jgi:hypothetical protein